MRRRALVLLDRIAKRRDERATAEAAFREALRAAKPYHSWAEIASAAGLSRHGVRYLANNENDSRKDGNDGS